MTDIDITQSNRVPLAGGGWVDLRPVQDITERYRRPLKKLSGSLLGKPAFLAAIREVEASGKDPEEMSEVEQLDLAAGMGAAFDELEQIQDLLIVAAVRGWSWESVPVSVDGILDLPGQAVDAIRKVVAPYQGALNKGIEPSPDPASPTAPSNA